MLLGPGTSALLRRETGARPPPLLTQRLYETAFKRLERMEIGDHGAMRAAAHCIARAPPALLQRDRESAAPLAVAMLRPSILVKAAQPTAAEVPLIVGVLRALEPLLQPDTTAAADALVPVLLS